MLVSGDGGGVCVRMYVFFLNAKDVHIWKCNCPVNIASRGMCLQYD